MKFYKVQHKLIIGEILGNSTAVVHANSPIYTAEYVKIDSQLFVFSIYDKPIWKSRSAYHQKQQLQLTEKELELFTECENPGVKRVSNIQFVIDNVDYEDRYEVERHTSIEDATARCGYLNDSTNEYHEVRVEFEYKWED